MITAGAALGAAFACSGDPEVQRKGGLAGGGGVGATDGGGSGGFGADGGLCLDGQVVCEGKIARTCNATGGFRDEVDCGARDCRPGVGCVVCTPGEATCAAGRATACSEDGSRLWEFDCDANQGMTCEAGRCEGACTPPSLANGYLGCDYWPTVTPNPVWEGFDFAVAVANAGDQPAEVLVTRGSSVVRTETVPAAGVSVLTLPWVPELKGGDVDACQLPPEPGATRVVSGGAYRLRTDAPVTVYQLSPLTYSLSPTPAGCPLGKDCPGGFGDTCLSFSNDATLLLPSTAFTGNYVAVSWPAASQRAGFVVVTAVEDDTEVELLGRGEFAAGAGIDAAGNGKVTLARGDVLAALSTTPTAGGAYGSDVSGTRVRATKPVQVIAGHSCANVPTASTDACDHLEHAMLPVETLGSDYFVTYPAALASQSPHVVRLQALTPGTRLTFDPPSVSAPVTLSPADGPLELSGVEADFRVVGDHAFAITQYLQGQASVPSGSGDPSMGIAVPAAQYRRDYVFVASETYDVSFVNVTAPVGATVTLDGAAVPATEFSVIGSSGWAVARVQLGAGEVHRVESDEAFGIVVYGYGLYTSYLYAGGLDLERITPPPVY